MTILLNFNFLPIYHNYMIGFIIPQLNGNAKHIYYDFDAKCIIQSAILIR